MSEISTTNPPLSKPLNATLIEIMDVLPPKSVFSLKVTFENYSGADFTITHQGDLIYTIENGPAISQTPQTQTKVLTLDSTLLKDDIGQTFSVYNKYKTTQEKIDLGNSDPFKGVVQGTGTEDDL